MPCPPPSRKTARGARLLRAAGLVALALAGLPTVASAAPPSGPSSTCALPATDLCTDYLTRGNRWAAMPVAYSVNDLRAPAGAALDIQDAFGAWQNEVKSPQVEAAYPGDRSAVAFTYDGLTTSTAPAQDGVNTVIFQPSQRGVAGASVRTKRGRILEFDISLNSNVAWQTDVTCPAHNCGGFDVQNVVTHEVGHVLDLYHVSDEADRMLTMYGDSVAGSFANETAKRDLGAGDVLGMRALYPGP